VSSPCHGTGRGRRGLDVGEIFRTHGESFRRRHVLSPEQARVMRAIERCRTAELGGHLDVCEGCGYERPSYNSCRDRHCPKCQALAQDLWLEGRKKRLLPTRYFHLVFTLPEELRGLALVNRRTVYGLMFRAVSSTLLELGRDPRHLGALVGVTTVLHTWSRDLRFHPHVHCIVTGGGLRADGKRWAARRGGHYLFPVKVMSRLFRGKLMAALVRARALGRLRFRGSCVALADDDVFAAVKDTLYRKEWIVYAKRPMGGAEQVYRYLGRYTHRVGLSNHRLRAIDDEAVRFATKDGRTVRLRPEEFIRRFLLHVLPKGFVKIRHYGLLAGSNVKDKLERARRLLGGDPLESSQDTPLENWRARLLRLCGVDLSRCPRCGTGIMTRCSWVPPRLPRAPPEAISS